jgi:predicted FMN-binding regulatory protein PaiB
MSEWITDRRPSWKDDLVSGLVFVSLPEVNRVITKSAVDVVLGEPWQRIPTPAPYVKPKRWTLEWNELRGFWVLNSNRNKDDDSFVIPHLTQDQTEAAQRICDIYNEVMP